MSWFVTSRNTSPRNFPKDESKAIHVSHDVGLKVISVQALIQHLWRHVALRADPRVGRYVNFIRITKETASKALSVYKRTNK